MKEVILIRICLLVVIVGVIVMFLSTRFIQPEEIKIKDVSEKQNYVKISGKVIEVSTAESGTTFLKIKDDTGTIDVVIFKGSIKNSEKIKSGIKIEIMGKPQKYKEKMEIIASSIQ